MSKRKFKPTSNLNLLKSLAPRTNFEKITEIADDDLLAFIGGLIRDRQRIEKRRPDWTVEAWLKRHPEVTDWLNTRGWTDDDAVEADKKWQQQLDKRLEKTKRKKIKTDPTQPYEVALLELARVEAKEHPKHMSITTSHYKVVPGSSASVCPNARPQIPQASAERLAVQRRECGLIDKEHTIHWVGSVRRPETLCSCEVSATIISLGDQCYEVAGHQPVRVDESRDAVLQAFLEASPLEQRDLIRISGNYRAVDVLRRLKNNKDLMMFSPAIRLPGGKGKGGYHVDIRKAEDDSV